MNYHTGSQIEHIICQLKENSKILRKTKGNCYVVWNFSLIKCYSVSNLSFESFMTLKLNSLQRSL